MNLKGDQVGINSGIAIQIGGFIGSGFVIPVNLAKKVMADIMETGKLTRGCHGFISRIIRLSWQRQ